VSSPFVPLVGPALREGRGRRCGRFDFFGNPLEFNTGGDYETHGSGESDQPYRNSFAKFRVSPDGDRGSDQNTPDGYQPTYRSHPASPDDLYRSLKFLVIGLGLDIVFGVAIGARMMARRPGGKAR
jgi:hypothetical protein